MTSLQASKAPVDFTVGDDLSDIIGSGTTAPKPLPVSPEFARIREAVPVFAESCPSCQGRGRFISHVGRDVGACFKCKGKGKLTFKTSPEQRAAAKASAAARKVAAVEAFAAAHPAEMEWLKSASAWSSFASDLLGKLMTYGELTAPQLAAVTKSVATMAAKAAAKVEITKAAAPIGFPNLRAVFDALVAKGVRKAQMTAGDINVSLAKMTGKNPGALYVKDGGEYAGKIIGTTFKPGYGAKADLLARLALVEIDPKAAVMEHAKMTAARIEAAKANGETITLPCGCCGLALTDPESIKRGIGPICAGKWGF